MSVSKLSMRVFLKAGRKKKHTGTFNLFAAELHRIMLKSDAAKNFWCSRHFKNGGTGRFRDSSTSRQGPGGCPLLRQPWRFDAPFRFPRANGIYNGAQRANKQRTAGVFTPHTNTKWNSFRFLIIKKMRTNIYFFKKILQAKHYLLLHVETSQIHKHTWETTRVLYVPFSVFILPEPHGPSYLTETAQKKTLQDNPNSPRIKTKYNTALSGHGEICLGYDLLDSAFFPSSCSKCIEFLTDGLTGLRVTASWHTQSERSRETAVYLHP